MRTRLLLLGLLWLGSASAAAGWERWAGAFPAFPCANGWSSCRGELGPISAGTWKDAEGRPMPADLRLGWFDLEAGPSVSPFVAPPAYPGAAPAPGPSAASSPPPEGPELVARPVVAPPPSSPATAPPPSSPATAPPPARGSTPVAVRPDAVASAALDPASTPLPAPATGCADLVALEPAAMEGSLSREQALCLEARVRNEPLQTTRDKVSRVLLANAEAAKDSAEWERLMRRHLDEIDQSDPDLCFKYAAWLSRQGLGRAAAVIRWAEVALENKHRWTGATYKSRVYSLLKLRAEASSRLWQAAETAYATGEHTPEDEARANRLRGHAKEHAKEWLDYATSTQQDTRTALALCVSAAGNTAWCEAG